MRILLVDDNEPLLGLLTQYLTRAGHEIVTATDFVSGLEKAGTAGALDAAVVDLILPDGSGEDLARQILDLHPSLQLVISSGMAYEAPKDLATRVRVFQKPFLPRQLLHILT